MHVLVTSKCDEDPIKNERVTLERPASHYKSMEFFRRSRAPNFVGSGPIQDFTPVLVNCKFGKRSDKKQQRKGGDIVFPVVSQWALSVGNQNVLIQSAQNPYAAFLPPQ